MRKAPCLVWSSRVLAHAGRLAVCLAVLFMALGMGQHAVAEPGTLRVMNVTLGSPADDTAEVLVTTSREPRYTARVANGGRRLLVDISDAVVTGAPAAIVEGNSVVAGVMTQAYPTQKLTRVLIQLKSQAKYRLEASPTSLKVTLTRSDKTGAASATLVKPLVKTAKAAVAKAPSAVSDVRFEHAPSGDQVLVDVTGSARFETFEGQGRSRIELESTHLPTALQRKLDTGAFGGAVRSVSTYRKPSDPRTVVIDIEHSPASHLSVERVGGALVCRVSEQEAHSMRSGIGTDGGVARKAVTVAREAEYELPIVETSYNAAAGAVETTTEPNEADGFMPGMVAQQRFNGRRIDLDLKDADVHNVLRLLADVGRVNIVTADNVSGSVTIRMRNVPWDQALETVLQAKGLGMVRRGNMIRVAPLADLNKERELAIARRKSELELAPIETRLIPVSYADAQQLQQRAGDMLSPRGSLAVDTRTNVLIARDVAGNLNQVEELVRSLDTQTPQVLIEARIVEATSRYLRDVGIQWGGDATFSAATGNDTGVAFPNSIGIAGGASDQQTPTAGLSPVQQNVSNPNFAVNLPAAVGTGQGGGIGLAFGSVDNNFNLNVRLTAAEQSGMLRIISSPRILTLDNRDARISQGTLIPFSQISAQGVQTTFQEAKLQLLVRPHVTADGSVSMHVKINRDEPDFNQTSARGDPTILKREAETELLVQDGHTAVIGGIFTRNSGRNLDQVPLLGDIPILGILFQRRRASDQRSELVIFLTPRIINRAEALGR